MRTACRGSAVVVRGGRVKFAATLATHRGVRGRRSCRTVTLRCMSVLIYMYSPYNVSLYMYSTHRRRIGSKHLLFLKALHLGSTPQQQFKSRSYSWWSSTH